jgi:copper homeostasis protein
MSSRTLEVPLDALDAARLAAPFADRIELCDDLPSEGWSPSADLVRAVRSAIDGERTEIVAMIRPRLADHADSLDVAGFATTRRRLDACCFEIEALAKAGAHSVAIGLLTSDGFVDHDACARMRDVALGAGAAVAFLRTFDLLVDRRRGLADIAELGFVRVVTAGVRGWDARVASIEARCSVLGDDVLHAEELGRRLGRPPVEIVPGGGVRSTNAAVFLGVSPHLHASCRRDGRIDRGELAALRAVIDAA